MPEWKGADSKWVAKEMKVSRCDGAGLGGWGELGVQVRRTGSVWEEKRISMSGW